MDRIAGTNDIQERIYAVKGVVVYFLDLGGDNKLLHNA